MPPSVERKLAAILSADIVGYSRLMAEDEDATVRRLGAYRDEVGLLVAQHRGRVVDFTGDNFLAEFLGPRRQPSGGHAGARSRVCSACGSTRTGP